MPVILLIIIDIALWKFHQAWHLPSPAIKHIGFYVILNIVLFGILIVWDIYIRGKQKRKNNKLLKPFERLLKENIISLKTPIKTPEEMNVMYKNTGTILTKLMSNKELIKLIETKTAYITEQKIKEIYDGIFNISTDSIINKKDPNLNYELMVRILYAHNSLNNIYYAIKTP
jgi:hypothetical protein